MKKIGKAIAFYSNLIGINWHKFFTFFIELPYYIRTYFKLKAQLKQNKEFKFGLFFPILFDKKESGGQVNGHYFHQDILVAKKIFERNPIRHIDIGSRTDGFVAHLAVFRKVEVFDIRHIESKTQNIEYKQADLMNLPQGYINCTDSISSLHAIEHFGLGRYGDPINTNGHLEAFENIYNMLKPNGIFYYSAPIGNQRIEFNAHRIFSIEYLKKQFQTKYEILSFSYVNDSGDLFENVSLETSEATKNFNCKFGCGIFELKKI